VLKFSIISCGHNSVWFIVATRQ